MFLKAWKLKKRSREVIREVADLDYPYLELRKNYSLFDELSYHDFMTMVRSSPIVFISSHDITDIFERTGYDFDRFAADLARLIRDLHAREEAAYLSLNPEATNDK